MSENERPMSASSRAESLDKDLRVMRASFQAAIVPNALDAILEMRPVLKTATGADVVNADMWLFLKNAALAAMKLIGAT